MPNPRFNKFRAAIEVLQRGRDVLVESLADDVLHQADDLIEGGFVFNEFLETQGTRLHFLTLLVAQLEQSAETLDEARAIAPPPPTLAATGASKPARKRKPRVKKLSQNASTEGSGSGSGSTDDA